MTVLKKVVICFHAVVVLSFAAVMELDTAFSERHETEPLAQPSHDKKKVLEKEHKTFNFYLTPKILGTTY